MLVGATLYHFMVRPAYRRPPKRHRVLWLILLAPAGLPASTAMVQPMEIWLSVACAISWALIFFVLSQKRSLLLRYHQVRRERNHLRTAIKRLEEAYQELEFKQSSSEYKQTLRELQNWGIK